MQKLIQQFLKQLATDGRDDQTVKNYQFYLKRFLAWSKIITVDELSLELVEAYRQWLGRQVNQTKGPLADSTKNYHLIALRSFFRYLHDNEIESLTAEQIKLTRLPNRKIGSLDNFELKKLLAAPLEIKLKKNIQWRDKALLELLFATGLRVSELANLQIRQINLDRGNFIIEGKHKKSRQALLSNQAKFWLKRYLSHRTDHSPFLFIRHDRAAKKPEPKNLTPRSIQRLINHYARLAGIKSAVTPRLIRHSLAINLIADGTDLKSIQSLLGQASILTTRKYRNVD